MSQLAELRTDKASGIIVGCFGVIMAGFAFFGLGMTQLQLIMLNTMPPIPIREDGFDFAKTMRDFHAVWWNYLPFTFAGGVLFAICGWRIYRGSNLARWIAQTNALLGYAWGVGYAIGCAQLVDRFAIPGTEVNESAIGMLRVGSFVITVVFNSLFPTALLFVLSRPKNQTLDAIVC